MPHIGYISVLKTRCPNANLFAKKVLMWYNTVGLEEGR